MGNNIFEKLTEKYPFITLCIYADTEYVGIIQNKDEAVTTIYDYGAIQTQQDKLLFLELASQWWWESNRQLPINIVLGPSFRRFQYSLYAFAIKEFDKY